MAKQKISGNNSEKIPSYVKIYNKIYSDIMNDVYKDGDNLPSESILTKQYGVSRNTLRQALAIIHEDGLIRKQQGKGSIITKNKKKYDRLQKEFFNPMIEYAIEDVDSIEINYNFGPPTEIARTKLSVEKNEMLLASNNIYYADNKVVGHSFMQIPLRHIESLQIDLNNTDAVSELLNKTIFQMSYSANVSIRLVLAEDHITHFLKVKEKEPIIYLEEILYNVNNEKIGRCKFYFIPSAYELDLWI